MSLKIILNILIIRFLPISLSAQNDKEAIEIQEKIWNKTGAEFKNTTIPEEWKNESTVILFQDYQYLFDRKGFEVYSKIIYHTRVALLDKAAIKEYSEFSFTERFSDKSTHQYHRRKIYNGLKVIKSNGTEDIVDMKTAVSVQSEIFNNPVKKVAIPDLQEGDIIDFYYCTNEFTGCKNGYHTFPPITTNLATNSPIVYSRRIFEVDDTFFVNYSSLNGAPKFTHAQKMYFRKFTIIARNIKKIELPYWSYNYRSLPTIKFQVMYSSIPATDKFLYGFARGGEIIKSKLTDFDIGTYGNQLIAKSFKVIDLTPLKDFTAKNGKLFDSLSPREKAKKVYYFLYHSAIKENLEKYSLGVDKVSMPGLNDYYFVQNMVTYFQKLDLNGELLLTVNRELTSTKDALLKSEFGFIIRGIDGGDIYFDNVSLHPRANSIPTEFEGAEAYVFPFGKQTWKFNKETLPVSNYKSNRTVVSADFSINEDMETINLHNNTKTFGHNRDWFQYNLLTMYDYLTPENKRMGIPPIVSLANKKEKIRLEETISEYKKNADKNRMELLERLVSIELNTTEPEVSKFNIIKNGRFDEEIFEFEYDVKFSGLLQPAGTHYLFNIGLLIGPQKEINEQNMTRTEDIYMPHARSRINITSCTIPVGYTVEGLEKLTFNIANETGGFISSASLSGNTLHIKTENWFTNNFEKAENWPKMLEFLEAAYEFTDVKILLKKQ